MDKSKERNAQAEIRAFRSSRTAGLRTGVCEVAMDSDGWKRAEEARRDRAAAVSQWRMCRNIVELLEAEQIELLSLLLETLGQCDDPPLDLVERIDALLNKLETSKRKMDKRPLEGVTDDVNDPSYICFDGFYIYRSESGWRWVNSAATKSSPAAFDSAAMCALNAERQLRT